MQLFIIPYLIVHVDMHVEATGIYLISERCNFCFYVRSNTWRNILVLFCNVCEIQKLIVKMSNFQYLDNAIRSQNARRLQQDKF